MQITIWNLKAKLVRREPKPQTTEMNSDQQQDQQALLTCIKLKGCILTKSQDYHKACEKFRES